MTEIKTDVGLMNLYLRDYLKFVQNNDTDDHTKLCLVKAFMQIYLGMETEDLPDKVRHIY